MYCPYCNHKITHVVDSRNTQKGRSIRRRRECGKCKSRFTTFETIELSRLMVVKRGGKKQAYDRSKIELGLRRSLEKRPVTEERIQRVLDSVEAAILGKKIPEIKSREIGRILLEQLKKVDEVAYLRFASVYKSFGSAESFQKEAAKMSEDSSK